jgi:signal transduction histidine kinase
MKLSRIHVEFETRSEVGRLRPEVETHLFRIVQEALSNIDSHSGSLNAIVRLERRTDLVILWIEDFRRGVPAAGTTSLQGAGDFGLGIFEIQERLRKIGGQLEIRSSNGGTMLTVSVRL